MTILRLLSLSMVFCMSMHVACGATMADNLIQAMQKVCESKGKAYENGKCVVAIKQMEDAAVKKTVRNECDAPLKRWYSLNGPYSQYSKGIHQPETRGDREKKLIEKIEELCKKANGEYKTEEKELTQAKNKCGVYNKYDAYLCDMGKTITGRECKSNFNNIDLNAEAAQNDSDNYTYCVLSEKLK